MLVDLLLILLTLPLELLLLPEVVAIARSMSDAKPGLLMPFVSRLAKIQVERKAKGGTSE